MGIISCFFNTHWLLLYFLSVTNQWNQLKWFNFHFIINFHSEIIWHNMHIMCKYSLSYALNNKLTHSNTPLLIFSPLDLNRVFFLFVYFKLSNFFFTLECKLCFSKPQIARIITDDMTWASSSVWSQTITRAHTRL